MTDVHSQRKVLLICNDVVGERMAGPGIRYWEFARVLSPSFAVTLAVPPFIKMSASPGEPDFPAKVVLCDKAASLRALAADADVIITLGAVLLAYPFLARTGKPLVLDLYDPVILEGLERHADQPMVERVSLHEGYRRAYARQIQAADFMICASERQRDYWLGMLSALGRANPYTHRDDETLYRLIDVVPFGLPSTPPLHTRPVLKGVHRKIAADDKVILWGGGLWHWLDAPSLVGAMALVTRDRPDAKLFFMGTERPNLTVYDKRAVEKTVELAKELDLYDRCIFFNDWVPYHDRQNYLLEADVGVSLHQSHIETRFAFRTRFLDYLWAGLPIVATEGDVMGDLVREWGLGRVVAPGNVEGVAQAVLDLLNTPELRDAYQPHFVGARARLQWEMVAGPLIEFCSNPRLAPDKAYIGEIPGIDARETRWWALPGKVRRVLAKQGISGLVKQTGEYLRWTRAQR